MTTQRLVPALLLLALVVTGCSRGPHQPRPETRRDWNNSRTLEPPIVEPARTDRPPSTLPNVRNSAPDR